jgi:hypothetical protein
LPIVPQAERHGDSPWQRSDARTRAISEHISAWDTPLHWTELFALESRRATLLYWLGVGLVVSGLFATHLLPCVDYPQHLALSDIARRLHDPNAPERAEYELNFFTYNGLFHFVVAGLSSVLPIELAGRSVVAFSLLAMAGATLALVRILRRPPFHAALFTPILFSFAAGWGFVNYVLATAVAAWTLVFLALAAIRPRLPTLLAVAALGLLCAFAHVLAMIVLCLIGAALVLELAWRTTPPSLGPLERTTRTLLRAALVGLPLLLGCAFCIEVYRRQYGWDPNMYRDPTMEGSAPPLWQKFVFFSAFATDLFGDATDQVVLWLAMGIMGFAAYKAWTRDGDRARASLAGRAGGTRPADAEPAPPVVAPFVVMTVAYFTTPMVLIGTHLIFPRLAQWAVFGAVFATPALPERIRARVQEYVLRLGVVAGLSLLLHCMLFDAETRDASAMIDDLPPGRSATAVIWEPGTIAFRNGTLTHLAAYYAARKHGQWAFAFARYLSVPVRFRPGSQPAWPLKGWEFDGEEYDPRCKYARAFPLVLIKAPTHLPSDASGESLVRQLVFKQDAAAVKLLSHHGRYWAFDTTGLPEDGTL